MTLAPPLHATTAAAASTLNATAVNFKGCNAPGAEEFAFCDMSLSAKARAEDLLSRFTLDQKLGMLSPNPTLGVFAHVALLDARVLVHVPVRVCVRGPLPRSLPTSPAPCFSRQQH